MLNEKKASFVQVRTRWKIFQYSPQKLTPNRVNRHPSQFTFIFSHSLRIIITVEWWRVCWKKIDGERVKQRGCWIILQIGGYGCHGIVSKHTSDYVFLFIFSSTNILYVHTIEGLLRWRRNQAAKKVSTIGRKIYYLKNSLCVCRSFDFISHFFFQEHDLINCQDISNNDNNNFDNYHEIIRVVNIFWFIYWLNCLLYVRERENLIIFFLNQFHHNNCSLYSIYTGNIGIIKSCVHVVVS